MASATLNVYSFEELCTLVIIVASGKISPGSNGQEFRGTTGRVLMKAGVFRPRFRDPGVFGTP